MIPLLPEQLNRACPALYRMEPHRLEAGGAPFRLDQDQAAATVGRGEHPDAFDSSLDFERAWCSGHDYAVGRCAADQAGVGGQTPTSGNPTPAAGVAAGAGAVGAGIAAGITVECLAAMAAERAAILAMQARYKLLSDASPTGIPNGNSTVDYFPWVQAYVSAAKARHKACGN